MIEVLTRVCLGMGSNLGDREGNLRVALDHLNRLIRLCRCSAIYETEPIGYKDQPLFLNVACYGDTLRGPEELLKDLKDIERFIGRLPTFPNGPRSIDLDILLFGDEVVTTPDLVIPHPRMMERAFVLVPLSEVAPLWVHPVLGKTISELANGWHYDSGIKYWGSSTEIFKA
jgi:2-amino-4-hydroxy-6-hydroxymethyldihydropteridine diphosphokinase